METVSSSLGMSRLFRNKRIRKKTGLAKSGSAGVAGGMEGSNENDLSQRSRLLW
tara:strand:- start:99 stop:260 length:162 start_codon:yes stop_codon:yes gene_type:complete